jgi:RNA recognition motif-containing protein
LHREDRIYLHFFDCSFEDFRGTLRPKEFWHLRSVGPDRPSSDPAPIHQPNLQGNEMKNIFVGNLAFGATEAAVRSLFEQYGTVERVSIVTDRDTGQARGFGFVEMSVNADADRAIAELNGRELDGRALNVNEARPKTERGFGGGGGGGGQRRNNRW